MEDLHISKNEALDIFSEYEKRREKQVAILSTRAFLDADEGRTESQFDWAGKKRNTVSNVDSQDRMNSLVHRMRDSIVSELSFDTGLKEEDDLVKYRKDYLKKQKHSQSFSSIADFDVEALRRPTIEQRAVTSSCGGRTFDNSNILRREANEPPHSRGLATNNIGYKNMNYQQDDFSYGDTHRASLPRKQTQSTVELSSNGVLSVKDGDASKGSIFSLYEISYNDRERVHQQSVKTFTTINQCYFRVQDDFTDIIRKCWLHSDTLAEEDLQVGLHNMDRLLQEYEFYRERLESLWDDIGRYERLESINQRRVEEVFGRREDLLREIDLERELGAQKKDEDEMKPEDVLSIQLQEQQEQPQTGTDGEKLKLSVQERVEISRLKAGQQNLSRGSLETGWHQNSRQLKDQAEKLQRKQLQMMAIAKRVRQQWKKYMMRRRYDRMSQKLEKRLKVETFHHWLAVAKTGAVDRNSILRWAWKAWITYVNQCFTNAQRMTNILNKVYYSRLQRMCFIFWRRWTMFKKLRRQKGNDILPPTFSETIPWWDQYTDLFSQRCSHNEKAFTFYRKTIIYACFHQIQSVSMENKLLRIGEENFKRLTIVKTHQKYFSKWKNYVQDKKRNKDQNFARMRKIFRGWVNLVEVRKRERLFPETRRKIHLRESFLRWRKRFLQIRLLQNAATVRIITKRPLALLAYSLIAEDHVQYSSVMTFKLWRNYWSQRKFFYWYVGSEWQKRRREILQYYFYILKYRALPPSRSNLDVVQDYSLMTDFRRFKRDFERSVQDRGDSHSVTDAESGFNLRMKDLFTDFMDNADPNSKRVFFQKIIFLCAARKRELEAYRTSVIISGEVEELTAASIKENVQRKFALARKVVGLFIRKQIAHNKEGDELTAMLNFMKAHIAKNRKLMSKKVERDRELALRFLAKEAAIKLASVSKTFKAVVQDTKLSSAARAQLEKIKLKKKQMEEELDKKRSEKMENSMNHVRTVVHKLKERARSRVQIIWDEILEGNIEMKEESTERPQLVRTASGRLTEVKDMQSFMSQGVPGDRDDDDDDFEVAMLDDPDTQSEGSESMVEEKDDLKKYKEQMQDLFEDSQIFELEADANEHPSREHLFQKKDDAIRPFTPQNNTSEVLIPGIKKKTTMEGLSSLSKPSTPGEVSSRARPKSGKRPRSGKKMDETNKRNQISLDNLFKRKYHKTKNSTVVVPGKIQEMRESFDGSNIHDSIHTEDTSEGNYSSFDFDDEINRLSYWIWDSSYLNETRILDTATKGTPTRKQAEQILSTIGNCESGKIIIDRMPKENEFLSAVISLGKEIDLSKIGKQDFTIYEEMDGFVVHFPREIGGGSPIPHSKLPFHERMRLRAEIAKQKREKAAELQRKMQQKQLEKIIQMQKESLLWGARAATIANEFEEKERKRELESFIPQAGIVEKRFKIGKKISIIDTVSALEIILRINVKQEMIYSEELMNDIINLRRKIYPIIMALKDSERKKDQDESFDESLKEELDQMKLRMSDMEKYLDIRLQGVENLPDINPTADEIPIASSLPYVLDMNKPATDLPMQNREKELLQFLLEDFEALRNENPQSAPSNIEDLCQEILVSFARGLSSRSGKRREEVRRMAIRKRNLLTKHTQIINNDIQSKKLLLQQTKIQKRASSLFDNVYFEEKITELERDLHQAQMLVKLSNTMQRDIQKQLLSNLSELQAGLQNFHNDPVPVLNIRGDVTQIPDVSRVDASVMENDTLESGRSQEKDKSIEFSVKVRPSYRGRRHSSVVQTSIHDIRRARLIDDLFHNPPS